MRLEQLQAPLMLVPDVLGQHANHMFLEKHTKPMLGTSLVGYAPGENFEYNNIMYCSTRLMLAGEMNLSMPPVNNPESR